MKFSSMVKYSFLNKTKQFHGKTVIQYYVKLKNRDG